MRKEEFYFDSRTGTDKIHAVRYTPDDGQVKGVVQIIHGMAEYIERYEEFAAFLTDRGFAVTGDDHLGHGKTASQGGTYGYFCKQDPATVVVRDVHRLKKMTQQLYPGVPYVILGHSMGSFILRNYMYRYGKGISGAIVMGTGMQAPALVKTAKVLTAVLKLFCGEKHVSKFMDKVAFGTYNDRIDKLRTASDWLSRNEANVDRYIADPQCGFIFTLNGFGTLFELIARAQKKENLEKVPKELPIFIVSGAMDPVGDYGVGVTTAYKSFTDIGIKDVSLKLYDNDRHEILNETDRETVMQDIYEWIENKILV